MRAAKGALIAIGCGIGLWACVGPAFEPGSPRAISHDTDQQLHGEDTLALCGAYRFFPQPRIRAELDARRAVAPEDWALIDRNDIRVGMSVCGLAASWGRPQLVKNTVTASRERTRYVYSSDAGPQTVIVENGVITELRTRE